RHGKHVPPPVWSKPTKLQRTSPFATSVPTRRRATSAPPSPSCRPAGAALSLNLGDDLERLSEEAALPGVHSGHPQADGGGDVRRRALVEEEHLEDREAERRRPLLHARGDREGHPPRAREGLHAGAARGGFVDHCCERRRVRRLLRPGVALSAPEDLVDRVGGEHGDERVAVQPAGWVPRRHRAALLDEDPEPGGLHEVIHLLVDRAAHAPAASQALLDGAAESRVERSARLARGLTRRALGTRRAGCAGLGLGMTGTGRGSAVAHLWPPSTCPEEGRVFFAQLSPHACSSWGGTHTTCSSPPRALDCWVDDGGGAGSGDARDTVGGSSDGGASEAGGEDTHGGEAGACPPPPLEAGTEGSTLGDPLLEGRGRHAAEYASARASIVA